MDSAGLRQAGVVFETMLLKTCLEPLEKRFDAVGSYGLDMLAQAIAQRDTRGFGEILAGRLTGRAE